jgi:hypothetical protein
MVILATGITLLLLASALFKRALIPHRIGTTPHCRRCNYNLSGLTPDPSTHCPECGLPLSSANIVHGERPRRRLPLAFAVLLGVAGLVLVTLPLYNPFRAVNWYAYKPTFWLLSDLESGDADVRSRAWTEIFARHLSDNGRARFDALLVRLYTARSDKLPPNAPDYLLTRFRHLTPEAQSAIFERLLPDLTAPPYTYPNDSAVRIARLESANDLSSAQHARLTKTALAAQAHGKKYVALDYLLNYLGRRELAGQLTPEQREAFFLATFKPVLDVRPTVLVGDDIPYYVHTTGRGPQDLGWSLLRPTRGQVDQLPPVPLHGGSYGNWTGGDGVMNHLPGTGAPGKHTVRITFEITAGAGKDRPGHSPDPPRWSHEFTLTRTLDVLPPGTDDLTWIDEPALAGPIRRALKPEEHAHVSGKAPYQFSMGLGIINSPANLAFDVIARDSSGKEYPLSNCTAFSDQVEGMGLYARSFPPGPNVGHVDLIFRSSERAMRNTSDLYEAWRGEIVLPNIAVTPEPPAPSTPPR